MDLVAQLLWQNPAHPLWVPYLFASVLLGAIVLVARGESLRKLIPADASSLLADIGMGMTGAAAILAFNTVVALLVGEPMDTLIAPVRASAEADVVAAPLGVWLALGVAQLVCGDFAFWFIHWLRHRVSALWILHAIHHSASAMNPITVLRRHPFEVMVINYVLITCRFLPAYIFIALFPQYSVAGVAFVQLLLAVLYVVTLNLQHSHVWLTFGPLVEHVIVSPAQHQIHHSIEPEHANSNFGQYLAIWDWMFGTLITADQVDAENIRFGVADVRHDTLRAIYLTPMVDFGRAVLGGLRREP